MLDSCFQVRSHGPGLAGAFFGAGWCFWVDAVLVNAMHGNKLGFLEVRSTMLLPTKVYKQP